MSSSSPSQPSPPAVASNAAGAVSPVPPPTSRRLLIDSTQLSVATVIHFGLMFTASVLIPKLLPPMLFGIWKTFQVVLQYTNRSHFGLLNAMLKEGPSLYASDDQRRFHQVTRTVFASVAVIALLESVAMLIGAWWSRANTLLALALVFLAFIVPLQQTHLFFDVYLNITKRFRLKSQILVVYAVLQAGLMVATLRFFGFKVFLSVLIVAHGLVLIWAILQTGFRPTLRFDWPETKRLFLVGLPIFGIVLVETLIQTTDRLITVGFLGMEMMGYYGIAGIVMPLILLVPISLRHVISVEVFHRAGAAGGSLAPVEDLFHRVVRGMALLMPVAGGILFLLSEWGLRFFLTRYGPGLPALKVVCLSFYPITLTQICFCYLVVARKEFVTIGVGLLAVGFNCAFTLLALGYVSFSLIPIAVVHGIGYLVFALAVIGMVEWLLARANDAPGSTPGRGAVAARIATLFRQILWPWIYVIGAALLLERIGPAGDAPALTGIDALTWSTARIVLLLVASVPLGYGAWRLARPKA